MNEENKNGEELERTESKEAVVNDPFDGEVEDTKETAEEAVENVKETAEEAAENVEEAAEEAAEDVKETVEDAVENAEETLEAAADTAAESAASLDDAPAKKKADGKFIALGIAAVVVIAVAAFLIVNSSKIFNKYNRMGYIDTTGRTIGEVADTNGYDLADFLAEYDLPEDMPASTYESAAYYTIPVSKIAEMYQMDFESLKEMLGWDDSITEDTTWGVAEGETTIGNYVGEDNIEGFKEQFSLGDDVTVDTKWKEVRKIIDQASRDEMLAEKEAEEAAEKEAAEATEEATEEAADEVASDDAAATAEATAEASSK